MSGNGPIGYPGTRPPARRPLADDPYTTPPTGQPQQPHWPPRYARAGSASADVRAAADLRSAPSPQAARSSPTARKSARPASRSRLLSSRRPPRSRRATRRRPPGTSCRSVARARAGAELCPAAQQLRPFRGGPIRRATISATTCRRDAGLCAGRGRSVPAGARSGCTASARSPTSAPRNRATARPTPTSTRCWPRKRSSRAAAAGA